MTALDASVLTLAMAFSLRPLARFTRLVYITRKLNKTSATF